jgi:hypothetical protein
VPALQLVQMPEEARTRPSRAPWQVLVSHNPKHGPRGGGR